MPLKVWLFALVPVSLLACAGADKADEPDDTDADTMDTMDTMDMPTDAELAADLWTAISGFETWPQAAPWEGIQYHSDTSPHGPWVQIWLNGSANTDWAGVTGGGSFSDGAILVKRLYEDEAGATTKPEIFAMWKVDGYNPAGGDWFWAKYDEEGNANPAGAVGMCVDCHASGSDYSRIATDVPGTPM